MRQIGTKAIKRNKDAINKRWREKGAKISQNCETEIRKMSINSKNLSISGNSLKLVTKFNRTKRIKNAIPYFNNLINVLEEIQVLDIIWNSEIDNELKKRQAIKEEEKQLKVTLKAEAQKIVKSANKIDLFNKSQIIKKLNSFSRVQQSMNAVFERLQDTNLEAARHSIISCRVGLEQFCMDAGGSRDWKTGLRNIYNSETDRKHIKAVWNYLSGKGAHGGHDPSIAEAEHCLKITMASLEAMLKKIEE